MKKYKYIVASLVTFVMIGCGGSSNPRDEKITSDSGVTLKGVAVDDLIRDGIVKVHPVNSNKTLKEGKTDQNGQYSFKVNYDGIVVVEVTCDAKSTMYNPKTKKSKPCKDVKLQSAAEVKKDDKEVKVNITPITDLVVRKMKEDGGDKKALDEAKVAIGNIFQVSPMEDDPIKNKTYEGTVSSVSKLAEDKNISIVKVLELLHEDTKDGESGNDGEIASELAEVMKKDKIVSTFTKNDGVVKPDHTLKTKTDIEVAKEFFTDLRTQALSMVDYKNSETPGFLDSEAKNLGKALEDVALDVNIVGDYSISLLDEILKAIKRGDSEYEYYRVGMDEYDYPSENHIYRKAKITQTENKSVWKYLIEERDTTVKYEGTVTLPSDKPNDINLGTFSTLIAKFDGELPLKNDEVGKQQIKMEASLTKSSIGADLAIKSLSIKNGKTEVVLSNLLGSVSYEYDDTQEEKIDMKFVKFNSANLTGAIDGYTISGKLEIPSYVLNSSSKDNGFEKEDYTTYVHGSVFCMGEHNEKVKVSGGEITYSDQLGNSHVLDIKDYGYFSQKIDGNIEKLDPNDNYSRSIGSSNIGTYLDDDANYSTYTGLKFDNLIITGTDCSDVKLMNLNIRSTLRNSENGKYQTSINGRAFCNNGGHGEELRDKNVIYKDKNGIDRTINSYNDFGDYFSIFFESDVPEVELTKGEADLRSYQMVNFDRIVLTSSSCKTPTLLSLNFNTHEGETEGEISTHIFGRINCITGENITDLNVTYTDKDGTKHIKNYGKGDGLSPFYGNIDMEIKGDVEKIPLTSGRKKVSYGEDGVDFSRVTIQTKSCSSPILQDLSITIDKLNGKDTTNIIGGFICQNATEIIDDAKIIYTDSKGNTYENKEENMGRHGGRFLFVADGNVEDIKYTEGSLNIQSYNKVDFDRIVLENSSCKTPILENLNIRYNDSKTNVSAYMFCFDNGKKTNITDGDIIYIDKSGKRYKKPENHTTGYISSKGSFYMSIDGNVENLPLNYGEKSYNALGFNNGQKFDRINITTTTPSCTNPVLENIHFYIDSSSTFYNSGIMPNRVKFSGNLKNTKTKSELIGTLDFDWLNATTMNLTKKSDDKIELDVSFSGTIKREKYPDMILNIGYTNPSQNNNFTFAYMYDKTTLNGEGIFDKNIKNGTIIFTSPNGIKAVATVKNGDIVYGSESSVTRNGRKVGTFEDRKGVPVIKYTDGTFESLP